MHNQRHNHALYVHIPFCLRRCAYCDFPTHAGRLSDLDRYVQRLCDDVVALSPTTLETVYVGGGTPSLLSATQLGRIMDALRSHHTLAHDCEISIECNPATADDDKLRGYAACGVNRISIGMQSANDDMLRTLGRLHSHADTVRTVGIAHKYFGNVSLDLMLGLPHMDMPLLCDTIDAAIALEPTHVSYYGLQVEAGTPFDAPQIVDALPDEDGERAQYWYASDTLAARGYAPYEISNAAKEGYLCRHNYVYWSGTPYIGVGAHAHGFALADDGMSAYRYSNVGIDAYLSGETVGEVTPLSHDELIRQYVAFGLRRTAGVDGAYVRERYGADLHALYGEIIERHVRYGTLACDGDVLRLTRRGIDVSNAVLCEFI